MSAALQEALDKGEADACLLVALRHYYGAGEARSYSKAFDFFLRAAVAGNATARAFCALALLTGRGCVPHIDKGLAFLEDALKGDSALAMRIKADLLWAGVHCKRDRSNSMALLKVAVAAGEPTAMYRLGRLRLANRDSLDDAQAGIRLIVRAANAKDSASTSLLGELTDHRLINTYNGWKSSKPPLRDSTFIGMSNVSRHLHLSYNKLALAYFETATHQGNEDGAFFAGRAYMEGIDCKVDFDKAFRFFRFAASRQHRGAMRRLGAMNEIGLGGVINVARARFWYMQANAKAIHPIAHISYLR